MVFHKMLLTFLWVLGLYGHGLGSGPVAQEWTGPVAVGSGPVAQEREPFREVTGPAAQEWERRREGTGE